MPLRTPHARPERECRQSGRIVICHKGFPLMHNAQKTHCPRGHEYTKTQVNKTPPFVQRGCHICCAATARERWKKRGIANATRIKDMTLTDRLLVKVVVDIQTRCWVWHGSRTCRGYGKLRDAAKSRSAHRVSYELFVGPIPEGLELDHLCRHPACVNPDHLEPVTRLENQRRVPKRPRKPTPEDQITREARDGD